MPKKKQKSPEFKLDAYESDIENKLPDLLDELPVSKNAEEEISYARDAADKYLRKNAKINIRLSQHDVEGLKRIAVREGMPYQTLIASILHKFVRRQLYLKS